MRLARLVCLFAFLAACGDDGGDPVLVDAEVPDAEPLPPDAEPFACMAPTPDECPGMICVDLDADESNCGTCGMECAGGEACTDATCACPDPFVPAAPSFAFEQALPEQMGIRATVGIFALGGLGHAMIVAINTQTVIDTEYTLDGGSLAIPLMLVGYNVNAQTQSFDAAYTATAGTITFSEICAEGYKGVATDVTFQGVTGGLNNPQVDPEGCTFTVESITFEYGTDCPAK